MDLPLDLSKKSAHSVHQTSSTHSNCEVHFLNLPQRCAENLCYSKNYSYANCLQQQVEPHANRNEYVNFFYNDNNFGVNLVQTNPSNSNRGNCVNLNAIRECNISSGPPDRGERKLSKTLLPCDVCQKTFDRPSLLKRHIRTHTGEKPHICEICTKGFSTSSSLNTHRRIHTGLKPHVCGYCGKRFTASSNLYYHRMTHTKIKPHKCTMCTRSFPTPGDLRSHMYVHSGTWPFRCHICSRGFSKQTNLRNHVAMHTGNRPFECQVCNKKFALQCNLKTHVKIHHKQLVAVESAEVMSITPPAPDGSTSSRPVMSTAADNHILPELYKNWLFHEFPKIYFTSSENYNPFQYIPPKN